MTCRHIWQCVCPSHDLHTFDSLSSSISWPADTFDNFCVHPSHDLQTFLTVVLRPSISWHSDTFQGGPYCHLIIQHSLFLFSTNCFQGTIWYWCHYFVFQIPWQRHALHLWYLNLTMQERAAEHSWTTKSPRQLQTKEQEINWLPKLTLCGWQDTKIQLLTKRHNFVLAQFKVEKACTYCNIKWLYM